MSILPRNYHDKANSIIQRLKADGTGISWNDKGIVQMDGAVIVDSKITNLVGDAVRSKQNINPTGWSEFAFLLKRIHVPAELVGNQRRKNFMFGTPKASRKINSDSPAEADSGPVRAGRSWKRLKF